MSIFKLTIGAAALWPFLFLLASYRDPPSPPPAVVPDQLAERWPAEEPIAPKADRLPIAPPAPIYVAKPEPQPLAQATAADIEQSHAERKRTVSGGTARNICTRHGMHKQVTLGGRSWRCRR